MKLYKKTFLYNRSHQPKIDMMHSEQGFPRSIIIKSFKLSYFLPGQSLNKQYQTNIPAGHFLRDIFSIELPSIHKGQHYFQAAQTLPRNTKLHQKSEK